MTKAAADVRLVVEKLAEAMALGIDPAEVAPPAHSPTVTLPDEHPAPWSYQEELEGHPVPSHHQEEPDAYTDDARRQHVVRNARGDVVVECVKFSKSADENLARVIAAIPSMLEEIKRLSGQATQHVAAIDRLRAYGADKQAEIQKLRDENENLDASCKIEHRKNDRLRTYMAEFESTIAKLNARLSDALKTAAPRAHATQQTEGDTESRGQPMPWDYKEEPDVEGGAS
jgi:hypothetical protein